MRKCPVCGVECGPEDELCAACGSGLRSGMVGRPTPPPEWEKQGFLLRLLQWVLEVVPGLGKVEVLVPSAVMILLAASGVLAARYSLRVQFRGPLFGLAVLFCAFSAAIGAMVYACALCWLLFGEVCTPQEALMEFKTKQWLAFGVLTLGPLAALFGIVKGLSVG